MRIGVDARPFQDPLARGVSSYGRSLLYALFNTYGSDPFRLFAAGGNPVPNFPADVRHLKLPSKLVNVGMRTVGTPTVDGALGVDRVWMPNLNFWSVGRRARLAVTVQDLSFLVDPTWYSARERLWHRTIGVRSLLRRADAILTLSGHTKRELVELLNLPPERIHHLRPGIPAVAPTTARHAAFTSFPYILFVGVVERRKNPVGAIRAFEAAAVRLPDHQLVFAGGPGAGAEEVRAAIGRSPVGGRIHLLGAVSHAAKGALLRGADALFLPSFYEGFGFPPLEAMSVGVPAVTSSASALPETVGNAALTLDPFDIGGFADALVAAITDPELRARLIARGYERVKEFSWDRCAEETWQVLCA